MSRAVLVTGASRGIGRAVAQRFADAGDSVAVHYGSRRDHAEQTLSSLSGDGHVLVEADLGDGDAARRLVDETATALGGLDVLVNNAGIFVAHPPTTSTWQHWQSVWSQTIAVNLTAAAHATFAAVPHLQRTGGAVVNVSSRGAFRGEPECPAYGASKAGLNAFGQSMAVALAPLGIGVATVAPGFVETDMARGVLDGPTGDAVRAQSPFGRVARADEVAAAVFWLASAEARFTSGTIVDVNGASYLRS
ncbi:MAG TPA: SDR family oxidoreductase [Mycobacteriales bacterium]|nr:SDR family oxidoreductase [Mycobacteriales bacterium]